MMPKITDLKLDTHNANQGTERGRYMVEHSLRSYGAGRSVLVDREGRIIAGNKTVEVAADIGIEDVIIVETDGTKLVAVKRTDLDLDEDRARLLAYADNRSSEVGLEWDADVIEFDLGAGVDLGPMFRDAEIDAVLGKPFAVDYDELWQGMPEFEQEDQLAWQTVKVHFSCQEDRESFSRLIEQKLTSKTKFVWYPEQEKQKQHQEQFTDES